MRARSPLPAAHYRAWTVLRHDVAALLVVFLVAVPLSLGIAVATGAPVMAGLIAAVVGGIVAGLLDGSPLQVSGPAAGLTVCYSAGPHEPTRSRISWNCPPNSPMFKITRRWWGWR
jgi:MFS superfamily sulfate permease-like transporter